MFGCTGTLGRRFATARDPWPSGEVALVLLYAVALGTGVVGVP